ncbi:MAG: hypothetical protein GX235_04870 [Clostridiales bacterium]|nr:hypothetical protein [Clostridiales bacterium]
MRMQGKMNQYFINLSILLVAWGGLFRRSFNCDTLIHMVAAEDDILIQIQDGRYLTSLIDFILLKLGLSTTTHTGVTVITALLLLALGLCFVQEGFFDKMQAKTSMHTAGFTAITALLFVNVMFGENLMFSECALVFGMAYLFASVGIYYFIRKKRIKAFAFILLSTTGYQVAAVYAAIVLTAYIFLDNDYKITQKTVIEEIVCCLSTFGAGVLNIISYTLIAYAGVGGGLRKSAGTGILSEKLGEIINVYIALLKNSKGLLPNVGLPLLISVFCISMLLYHFVKKKDKMAVLYFILLFFGLNVMIFVIPILQQCIYMPPRIIWTFYAVQSMLLLVSLACVEGKLKRLVCYIGCGYLLIQIIFGNVIVANRTLSNNLDKLYANMVYEKILKYEEEEKTQITKLAVVNDVDCALSYDEVHYKTDQINERALGIVTNTLMNVVTGRNFEKVPMDEEIYNTYFAGKNWDYFDASEQLIIKDDTAYWVIF